MSVRVCGVQGMAYRLRTVRFYGLLSRFLPPPLHYFFAKIFVSSEIKAYFCDLL